jgi:hypothetical protein
VAEGARLESVFRGNSNVGSNPTLSASQNAASSRVKVSIQNRKLELQIDFGETDELPPTGHGLCADCATARAPIAAPPPTRQTEPLSMSAWLFFKEDTQISARFSHSVNPIVMFAS